VISLRMKQLRSAFDKSPPLVENVKKEWSYKSTTPIRLHGVHINDVSFLLLSLHVFRSSLDFTNTRKGCACSDNGNHSVKSRRVVAASGFEPDAVTARA